MRILTVLGLVSMSFVSTLSWGAINSNLPTPIPRDLKLQSYIENLSADLTLEKMDSEGKSNPDIFVVFKKNDLGVRQLQMQAFDLDRDSKIDLVKHFLNSRLSKVETDADYDGKVDVITEYDSKSGEIIRKTQTDGKTNIWKYYSKNEMRRKELDRNQDGKPDMWVYYRNGKILRTEIDQKFDGKAIRVEGPLVQKKTVGG